MIRVFKLICGLLANGSWLTTVSHFHLCLENPRCTELF
jgi:hypothetical protein